MWRSSLGLSVLLSRHNESARGLSQESSWRCVEIAPADDGGPARVILDRIGCRLTHLHACG